MTPSTQQFVSISRRTLDVGDYIDIVRRHISWILAPMFAGLVLSCVYAFSQHDIYVSKAVMRIAPPQISAAVVQSTVAQEMNERISVMEQQILSRASLSEMIQRPALNLYPKQRATQPIDDLIEQMRSRDIHLAFYPLPGNRNASALQIEFVYPDRFKAQAVVNALVASFMETMVKVTGDANNVTTEFLKEELTKSKAELDRLDTEITNFRVQNAGHLPEELQVNAQALNGLQAQMGGVNDSLSRLAEDSLTLQTNLQTLKMQRDTYKSMAEAQDPSSGAKQQSERLALLNNQIGDYEGQLLQLGEMYTDSYPTIKNIKSQLALKKRQRDELQLKEDQEALKPKPAAPKRIAVNPMMQERMNDIQGGIDMVNTQLRNKESERLQRLKQLDDINKAMATYQSRISSVPANQQKYVALLREHELASQRYQDLERKESAVGTSDAVNKRKAGENLEVLDNASLPESPALPNRMFMVGVGTGLGLMLGVFLAGVKEVKDTSLKNLKDVRAYTNLPILSSIPLLENDVLVRRKRRLAYLGWTASVLLGAVAISGSMYYHYFLKSSS